MKHPKGQKGYKAHIKVAPGITRKRSTVAITKAHDAEIEMENENADAEIKKKLAGKYAKVDAIFEKIGTGKHLSVADVVTLSDGTINILFFKKLLENDFGPDKYVAMLGELESIAISAKYDADRIRAIDVLTKKIEQVMRIGVDKKDIQPQAHVNITFSPEFVEVKNFYDSGNKTSKAVRDLPEFDNCPVPDNHSGNPQWENLGTQDDSEVLGG